MTKTSSENSRKFTKIHENSRKFTPSPLSWNPEYAAVKLHFCSGIVPEPPATDRYSKFGLGYYWAGDKTTEYCFVDVKFLLTVSYLINDSVDRTKTSPLQYRCTSKSRMFQNERALLMLIDRRCWWWVMTSFHLLLFTQGTCWMLSLF